jgi:hypothetical protein
MGWTDQLEKLAYFVSHLEYRVNLPLLPMPGADTAWEGWQNADEALRALRGWSEDPPEFLLVLTTYARPQACLRTLQMLKRSSEFYGGRVHLLVLNDSSETCYAQARDYAHELWGSDVVWLDAIDHHGKTRFWRAHQVAFDAVRLSSARLYFSIQDDVCFDPDLLVRVRDLWNRLPDDEPRLLYLMSCPDDEPRGRWVRYERREVPGMPVRRTQWFDLQAFVCDERFVHAMGSRVLPIRRGRWKWDPMLSSGVARQLTLRSLGRCAIYQAHPSLVTHGHEESLMNPEARDVRALDNRVEELEVGPDLPKRAPLG